MNYNPAIYITDRTDCCRFALGNPGKNPLFVMGLNPSTATDRKPDRTISKVINYAEILGYDGFIMINIYPQRATSPDDLDLELRHEIVQENLEIIDTLISRYVAPNILAAWGNPILIRPYLINVLRTIEQALAPFSPNWFCLGTLTQTGHPRHPSRTAYDLEIRDFDIDSYFQCFI